MDAAAGPNRAVITVEAEPLDYAPVNRPPLRMLRGVVSIVALCAGARCAGGALSGIYMVNSSVTGIAGMPATVAMQLTLLHGVTNLLDATTYGLLMSGMICILRRKRVGPSIVLTAAIALALLPALQGIVTAGGLSQISLTNAPDVGQVLLSSLFASLGSLTLPAILIYLVTQPAVRQALMDGDPS